MNPDESNRKKIDFLDYKKDEFSGIIIYLRLKSGDQFTNEIEITATSIYSQLYSPANATLFEDQHKCYLSKNEYNSWLCIDFKLYNIIPVAYKIRTMTDSEAAVGHLKNWIIEVSLDKNSWLLIDERNNDHSLNGPGFLNTFVIRNPVKKGYRYLRIRQTETNSNGQWYLGFDSFEIYGSLISI